MVGGMFGAEEQACAHTLLLAIDGWSDGIFCDGTLRLAGDFMVVHCNQIM